MKKIIVSVIGVLLIALGALYYFLNFQPAYNDRELVNTRYGFTLTVPEGWYLWHDASALNHALTFMGEKYKSEGIYEMEVISMLETYGEEIFPATQLWTPDNASSLSFSSLKKDKNDFEDSNDIGRILQEGVNEPGDSIIVLDVTAMPLPLKRENSKERIWETFEINGKEIALLKNTNELGEKYTAMIPLERSEVLVGNQEIRSKTLWITHRSGNKEELLKFVHNIHITE